MHRSCRLLPRVLSKSTSLHARVRQVSGKALVADFQGIIALNDTPEAYNKLNILNKQLKSASGLSPAQISSIIESTLHLKDRHVEMTTFLTHIATLVPKHRYTPAQMVSIITGLRNVRLRNLSVASIYNALAENLLNQPIVPGIKTVQTLCQVTNNRLISPYGELPMLVDRFLSAVAKAKVYLPLDSLFRELANIHVTYDNHPLLLYYATCISSHKSRFLSTSNRVHLLDSVRYLQFHHLSVQRVIEAIMTTKSQTPPDITSHDFGLLCGVLRMMPVTQYKAYLPVLQFANACFTSDLRLNAHNVLKSIAACRNMSNTHPDVATFVQHISGQLPQNTTPAIHDKLISSAFFGLQCMKLTESTRRIYAYLFELLSQRLSKMPNAYLANLFCGFYHLPSEDASFIEAPLHALLREYMLRLGDISITAPSKESMSFVYNTARHLQLFEHNNHEHFSPQTRYMLLQTKLQLLPFLSQHCDPSSKPAESKAESMLYENCVAMCSSMHHFLKVSNRGHTLGFQCDIMIEIEHPAYKLNIEIDGLFHLDAYKAQFCEMRDTLFKSRGVEVLRLNVRHYDDTFVAVEACSYEIKTRLEKHLLSIGLLRPQ